MKKQIVVMVASLLVIGVFLIPFFAHSMESHFHKMEMGEKRESFMLMKSSIQDDMRQQQKYRCCLEKPCTLCIEKTPSHGEGASCDCLADIVDGRHPCGECIGEILEGHGSPYLSEYFARAVAEDVGEQHLDTLKEIVFEKYGTPVEDQL